MCIEFAVPKLRIVKIRFPAVKTGIPVKSKNNIIQIEKKNLNFFRLLFYSFAHAFPSLSWLMHYKKKK